MRFDIICWRLYPQAESNRITVEPKENILTAGLYWKKNNIVSATDNKQGKYSLSGKVCKLINRQRWLSRVFTYYTTLTRVTVCNKK